MIMWAWMVAGLGGIDISSSGEELDGENGIMGVGSLSHVSDWLII
jgi:hypothetical protein